MIGRGHRAQGLEEGTNRTPEHHQVRVVAGAPFAVALVQRSRKEVALCLITLGISQDELGEGCSGVFYAIHFPCRPRLLDNILSHRRVLSKPWPPVYHGQSGINSIVGEGDIHGRDI